MKLTFNDRNYALISKEEWLYIAETVANYLSGGNYSAVEYDMLLRPYDAAIIAVEEANYFVGQKYQRMNWKTWKAILFETGFKSALLSELVVALDVTIIVVYMKEYSFSKGKKYNPGEKVRKGTWCALACEMLRFTFSYSNLVCYRANNWHWQ